MTKFYFYDIWSGDLLFSGGVEECARHFHCSARTIYRAGVKGEWRWHRVAKTEDGIRGVRCRSPLLYTVYDREDNAVVTGTAEECAVALGYRNKGSFLSVVCKSVKGQLSKYKFVKGYCE